MTTHQDFVFAASSGSSVDTSVVFAPWTIARVGGLPAQTCELVSDRTAELLARSEALTAELPPVGETLANACFEVVPLLDDSPGLRRVALAVKRAAHKGSVLPSGADDLAQRLPCGHEVLAVYQRLTDEAAESRRELASAVAADSERARATLIAQLEHQPFVRSLALAAPEWARHGLDKARQGRMDARNLRTVYSYVTRTAVKTSPYSRLTTVAMPGSVSTETRSYAGAALAHLALHAVARDHRLAGLLRYRIAPHTDVRPGGFVLHGQAGGDHVSWMSTSVAHDAAAPAWLFDTVNERDYELGELFGLLGGRDPWARYLRMLDSGWVHPVACSPGTGDPLGGLVATLATAGDDHPMTRDIRRICRAAHDLASSSVTERTATIAVMRQAQAEWRAVSGIRMWTPDLVYEDAATGLSVPDPLDAETALELGSYAAEMRPHFFRSHLYDFLLDAFVSRFGRGGRCEDVFGFLAALTAEDRIALPMSQALMHDRSGTDAAGRAQLPVGHTSAPPTVAVLFQKVATESHRLLVVNQLCDGIGGMVGRFTGILGDRLSGALDEWFASMWPGMPRHELVNSRACTTAQYTSAGLLPALTVPGDGMPVKAGDLPLDRATLIHDAHRNVLELLGPGGRPFGLAYLGLIPAHLSSGMHRLLTILANPWMAPHTFADRQLTYPPLIGTEVIAYPRRTVGRTVVERANWLCPVDRLPLPVKGESEDETVLRAHRWRREHGIPPEVFCRRTDEFTAKPLWVDLRSAISLAVLRQELPEHGWVRIAEALPGCRQHPLRGPSGQSLASEYVVGLRWPRPEVAA